MTTRLTDELGEPDAAFETTLRPEGFDQFTGQDRVCERLEIAVTAATQRKEPIDHLLLSGPPGLGKTTIAHIIAKAFLGVEMQCARCHDAPYHPYRQRQLFSLGAMLAGSPLSVPKGSSVDLDAAVRRPQVEVTLKPGTKVSAVWPFKVTVLSEPVHASIDYKSDTRNLHTGTI